MSRPLRSLPRPILRQPLQNTSIRHASRYANRSLPRRFVSTTILLGGTAALVAYYYDSRSALHEHIAMPLIRMVADAETGHKMSIKLLGAPSWMRPRDRGVDGEELQAEVRDPLKPGQVERLMNVAIRYEAQEPSRYGCWTR
jgi:dihydroorotate dehydrogenase